MSSTGQKLRRAIEQEIVTQKITPGARLDEVALAQRFGTSRTPVREALLQLASSGLVEVRPRRGAVVAQLSLSELVEMFEVMAELEGMCGRLAAQRATEEELEQLMQIHETCKAHAQANRADAYYDENVRFHEAIYGASHNRFLAQQTIALRNRLAPYRRLQLRRRNRPVESFEEHEQIAAAICEAKPDEAERLLREHVTKQSGSFGDFVLSLPSEYLKPDVPPSSSAA
ncbi:MAG: GntR family transcriptional regulator [Hyphomicrobiales bacterium]